MPQRDSYCRILFQVILLALAVGAVAGCIATLLGSYEVVGRVSATALLTALTSGVIWRLDRLLEDEDRNLATAGLGPSRPFV